MKFFIKLLLVFLSRFKAVILISVVMGLLVFITFEKIAPNISNIKPQKIAITGRYTVEELPDNILHMISKGLTTIEEDGTVLPGVGDWSTSDKGKTWVFKINGDHYWQDNKKLVSNDIGYLFTDVNVIRDSEDTITYQLKDPFSPFPAIVSKPLFKKGLLGLGEWKVKNLKLNGNYVQELFLENSSGKKVIYKFFPTEDASKTAFKMGRVDEIHNLSNSEPFERWNTAKVDSLINTHQVVTLFFNTQDKYLSDKSLRQALVYSIDKNALGPRALSPIASTSWAYNPQVKEYAFDSMRAKEILSEMPKDVMENLAIKLVTTPILLDKAEDVAKAWNKVGIKTEVQISSVIPTEFQAYVTILDLPDDPDQYPLWHSTQTNTNISKYTNPRIDKLLEDGRVAIDIEERKRIYLDFQRFLLEDVPAAFLYHPINYQITRK